MANGVGTAKHDNEMTRLRRSPEERMDFGKFGAPCGCRNTAMAAGIYREAVQANGEVDRNVISWSPHDAALPGPGPG